MQQMWKNSCYSLINNFRNMHFYIGKNYWSELEVDDNGKLQFESEN